MKKIKALFTMKRAREWALAGVDAVCVAFALFISTLLSRFQVINSQILVEACIAIPLYVGLSFISSLIVGVYRCIWRYANIKDYVKVALSCAIASILFSVIDMSLLHLINEVATYIVAFVISMLLLTFTRIVYAVLTNMASDNGSEVDSKRTMIIGAGYTAKSILEELTRKHSLYKPCCLIDDDVSKIGRAIFGVPVVGNSNEIVKFAKRYDIEVIIFAIPSLPESSRKTILNHCLLTECELKVLPYMDKMIHNVNIVSQIKDINIADLLGRAQIKFDDKDIHDYVSGRSVMITGGGGSIGSELVRQIATHSPKRIIIVEIYENCAYDIQQEILRTCGKDFPLYVEIASVTDYDKMDELFDEHKPDIVYHAAAHKHVPLMETNPEEAVKNNVYGTYNVSKLALEYGINKFIMISTDKAVNPTNIMGATKRLCEMIVQSMAQCSVSTEFASVRFGNVLGSNGSVIPLFQEQIKAGGPVMVTHKDIIRYFMTIPEAVCLVLQAGAYAKGGEIFVLDMGAPVKILTLAENLIRMMGYRPYDDIDIKFSGLRPGEKLYEELLMGEEGLSKTANEKIFIGKQSSIDVDSLEKDLIVLKEVCMTNDKENVMNEMKRIVPTFTSQESFKTTKKMAKQPDKLLLKKSSNL